MVETDLKSAATADTSIIDEKKDTVVENRSDVYVTNVVPGADAENEDKEIKEIDHSHVDIPISNIDAETLLDVAEKGEVVDKPSVMNLSLIHI